MTRNRNQAEGYGLVSQWQVGKPVFFFFIKFHISIGNSYYCYLEPLTFFPLRSYFLLYRCTCFFMSTHNKKKNKFKYIFDVYKFDDPAIYRYIRVQTKLDITCVCTIQVHTGQLNLSFKFAGHEKGR